MPEAQSGVSEATAVRPWYGVHGRSFRGAGFTLIELLIGVAIVTIAIAALLGVFIGQMILNEHARNLTWAMNDAGRVMERLRQRNTSPCAGGALPTALPPNECGAGADVCASWDAWLSSTAGGGKSIQPTPTVNELVVMTCQDQLGMTYCGRGAAGVADGQLGDGEWSAHPQSATAYNPLRITVAVCWRHRGRTLGECAWSGAALTPDDAITVPQDASGVIDSPAMVSTTMTCR